MSVISVENVKLLGILFNDLQVSKQCSADNVVSENILFGILFNNSAL